MDAKKTINDVTAITSLNFSIVFDTHAKKQLECFKTKEAQECLRKLIKKENLEDVHGKLVVHISNNMYVAEAMNVNFFSLYEKSDLLPRFYYGIGNDHAGNKVLVLIVC